MPDSKDLGARALREDLADLRRLTSDGFTDLRGRLDAAAAAQLRIISLLTALLTQRADDPYQPPDGVPVHPSPQRQS